MEATSSIAPLPERSPNFHTTMLFAVPNAFSSAKNVVYGAKQVGRWASCLWCNCFSKPTEAPEPFPLDTQGLIDWHLALFIKQTTNSAFKEYCETFRRWLKATPDLTKSEVPPYFKQYQTIVQMSRKGEKTYETCRPYKGEWWAWKVHAITEASSWNKEHHLTWEDWYKCRVVGIFYHMLKVEQALENTNKKSKKLLNNADKKLALAEALEDLGAYWHQGDVYGLDILPEWLEKRTQGMDLSAEQTKLIEAVLVQRKWQIDYSILHGYATQISAVAMMTTIATAFWLYWNQLRPANRSDHTLANMLDPSPVVTTLVKTLAQPAPRNSYNFTARLASRHALVRRELHPLEVVAEFLMQLAGLLSADTALKMMINTLVSNPNPLPGKCNPNTGPIIARSREIIQSRWQDSPGLTVCTGTSDGPFACEANPLMPEWKGNGSELCSDSSVTVPAANVRIEFRRDGLGQRVNVIHGPLSATTSQRSSIVSTGSTVNPTTALAATTTARVSTATGTGMGTGTNTASGTSTETATTSDTDTETGTSTETLTTTTAVPTTSAAPVVPVGNCTYYQAWQQAYISDPTSNPNVVAVFKTTTCGALGLNLPIMNVTAADMVKILPGLQQLVNLTGLYLPKNPISDAGARLLVPVLPILRKLSRLDLNTIGISAGVAMDLVASMQELHLTFLGLTSGNEISDAEALVLAAELRKLNLTALQFGSTNRTAQTRTILRAMLINITTLLL